MTYIPYAATLRTTKADWNGLGYHIVDADYSMSVSGSVALTLTVQDTLAGDVERIPGLWEDGVEVKYGRLVGTVQSVESGGDAESPTIILHVISQGVAALNNGGTDPGYATSTNVPGWVDATIGNLPTKYHKVIDANLGDKQIEAAADTGDGTDEPDTTWDTLNETAKRCGAWCWFTDTAFFFGKPSWLVDHGLQSEWTVVWNSWTDHSEALLTKPARTFDLSKKLWEGREELTLRFADPEASVSGNRLARNMRPGDRLVYKGKASPADKLWIIASVDLPRVNTDPVTVTCWRPIDPPELIDENGSEGGAGGEAGVPQGPIGAGRWDGEQLVNAAEIVKEGQRRDLPKIALVLAVQCAMGESTLDNVGHGDDIHGVTNPDGSLTTSVGLFQQQNSWGSRSDRMTPSKSAGFFYDALVKTNYKSANDASSSSMAIHRVQINADPMHYARFWDDANLVVDACISAGKSSGGGDGKPPSGPLGERMKRSIDSMNGRTIDYDGSFGGQCADVSMKYAKDLWGIGMVIGNGKDYWRNPQLMPHCEALPPSAKPRYGDIMSWSGSGGAYANGGYGHVAIYISGDPGSGTVQTLSQNPGPARIQPLSTSGLLGWMRPKG